MPATHASLDADLKSTGLAAPAGWGRATIAQKEAMLSALASEKTPAPTKDQAERIGSGRSLLGGLAAGVVAMAGAAMGVLAPDVVERPAVSYAPERAKRKPGQKPEGYVAKTVPHPGYKRRNGGGRGWYPTRKAAPDPEPMTRQVRRQNERRGNSMMFFDMPNAKELRSHHMIGA